jgi:putative oxidoreductase
MTTAIAKVHRANGPWAANGGWEYNAALIGALTALAETGPRDLSLDHALISNAVARDGHSARLPPAWGVGAAHHGGRPPWDAGASGRR